MVAQDTRQAWANQLRQLAVMVENEDAFPIAMIVHIHYVNGRVKKTRQTNDATNWLQLIGALGCEMDELTRIINRVNGIQS